MTIGEADDISKQPSKDLQDILKHLQPPEIPDYNSLKQDRLERIENLIIEQAIQNQILQKQEHTKHIIESFIIAVTASVLSAVIVKFLL